MEVVETHWILAPTRIVRCRVLSEAHLQHFEREIRERVGPMDYVTNVHGQMTDWQQFNHDPIFHEYVSMIGDRLRESGALAEKAFSGIDIKDAWGNLLKSGDYVEEHSHIAGGTDYATVVYFGDSEITVGNTIFHNDRGHVLTFPASLQHSVPPAKEERITMAFNWAMLTAADKWDEPK